MVAHQLRHGCDLPCSAGVSLMLGGVVWGHCTLYWARKWADEGSFVGRGSFLCFFLADKVAFLARVSRQLLPPRHHRRHLARLHALHAAPGHRTHQSGLESTQGSIDEKHSGYTTCASQRARGAIVPGYLLAKNTDFKYGLWAGAGREKQTIGYK